MLVEKTEYLTAGIHIGMKTCTPYMKQFVYKLREDGLNVFNLQKIDERLLIAAKFLSKYKNMLVASRKDSVAQSLRAFGEVTGSRVVAGRFIPGSLTNPSYKDFFEPDVVFVVDPLIDEQAIKEAKKKRIPIVALCDTFNTAKDIDIVIPSNNNGKKSLATIFWIIAREILKERGEIKSNSEFKHTLEYFGERKEERKKRTDYSSSKIKEKGRRGMRE